MSNPAPDHDRQNNEKSSSTTADTPRPDGSGADPLGSLYRMSKTAGLGSQEYVAVNATSVIALLLGLASASAVLFGAMLLVVPVVAIILSIVAIRQINRSAGTETGKGLAILGIGLALLFTAVVGGKELRERSILKEEQGKLTELMADLGKKLSANDLDGAWQLFSDRFQATTTKDEFTSFWARANSDPNSGFRIVSTRSTGLMRVTTDADTGGRTAEGQIIFVVPGSETPVMATFRKTGDKWYIDTIALRFRILPGGM